MYSINKLKTKQTMKEMYKEFITLPIIGKIWILMILIIGILSFLGIGISVYFLISNRP